MPYDLPTFARRSAAVLACISIGGCDATRTVDAVADGPASHLISLPAAASYSTGVGVSATTVESVNLANPSFEAGYDGWTHSSVDIGALWQASDGSNSADLNGFFPGSVSQNVATIPGVRYTVLFDLAGNPGSPQGVKTMTASAGATSATYAFNTSGKSVSDMGWTPQTFSFTATAATTTLTFTSNYTGNGTHPDRAQGPALDNVRVTWVPTATTTTVTFGSGPFVYEGSAFTATASVSPAGAGTATIVHSGECTNAGGTCTATATFAASGQYAGSSASASITIDKAPTTTTATFGSGSFVYTGTEFAATASVSPAAAGATSISYSGDCLNAGNTCSATATFAGNDNYAPSSSAPAGIVIAKAPTETMVTFGTGPTVVYTGTAFSATASVSPTGAGLATISYSGECIYAGTCTATATYAGSGNYLSSSATTSITIKYPVASTADGCKKGGWRFLTDDLGTTFRNQGDCQSFVATRGKNKGAGTT